MERLKASEKEWKKAIGHPRELTAKAKAMQAAGQVVPDRNPRSFGL